MMFWIQMPSPALGLFHPWVSCRVLAVPLSRGIATVAYFWTCSSTGTRLELHSAVFLILRSAEMFLLFLSPAISFSPFIFLTVSTVWSREGSEHELNCLNLTSETEFWFYHLWLSWFSFVSTVYQESISISLPKQCEGQIKIICRTHRKCQVSTLPLKGNFLQLFR